MAIFAAAFGLLCFSALCLIAVFYSEVSRLYSDSLLQTRRQYILHSEQQQSILLHSTHNSFPSDASINIQQLPQLPHSYNTSGVPLVIFTVINSAPSQVDKLGSLIGVMILLNTLETTNIIEVYSQVLYRSR